MRLPGASAPKLEGDTHRHTHTTHTQPRVLQGADVGHLPCSGQARGRGAGLAGRRPSAQLLQGGGRREGGREGRERRARAALNAWNNSASVWKAAVSVPPRPPRPPSASSASRPARGCPLHCHGHLPAKVALCPQVPHSEVAPVPEER